MSIRERLTILGVATVTLFACAVFASTLVHAGIVYDNQAEITPPEQTAIVATSATSTKATKQSFGRLLIPSIGINANIQSVGIGRSGNMAVPTNFTDVGWYRYGPPPGQRGSAVIDGHVDNGFGMDAVFKRIVDLQPGDDIYVESGGVRTHFVVEDVETYNAAEVPTDLVFNRTDQSRLNLITCAGTWSSSKRAYDERTVVYAVLAQ
jgi:sortase (surface protein transpeptidase)